MKRVFIITGFVFLCLVLILAGYFSLYRKPEKEVAVSLVPVSGRYVPRFADDLNGEGLKEAIRLHIKSLRRKNLNQKVRFGEMEITRKRILKTLELFYALLEKKSIPALQKEIPRHFLIFQSSGLNRKGDVLFTGYYQPVLDARVTPEGEYIYPIYKRPPDLQVIDLGNINPTFTGEKIALRIDNGIIKPYFDRKAIDEDLVLQGKGLELVYLRNFLDRYMLHVQGSGVMNVENGQVIKVRYAASNCFPYVSLGKLLRDAGRMKEENISLKTIREYYQENPKEVKDYLYRNHRYIFFEEFTGNVAGSEGVELTPGRSIATDKSVFPGGGLAFVMCQRPVRNPKGRV
ncbi:MAG: MltA domain-containing protein, partial [Pseudomonadota bacterium]